MDLFLWLYCFVFNYDISLRIFSFLITRIMQIAASTILSFYTRGLYSKTPPTVLFDDLIFAATGNHASTIELIPIANNYSEKILAQCPKEFQKICREWQHVPDWQTRIELIDETFGCIPISFCA